MIPKDKFPTTFGLITDGLTIVPVDNVIHTSTGTVVTSFACNGRNISQCNPKMKLNWYKFNIRYQY